MIIALPQQEWLGEGSSILRYTYNAIIITRNLSASNSNVNGLIFILEKSNSVIACGVILPDGFS
jgi:hypothetical protein